MSQARTPLHRETLTVAAGYDSKSHHGAVKPPLFSTSTFSYASAQQAKDVHRDYFRATPPDRQPAEPAYIYSRLDHPNMTMLQARLAALDGAEDAAVFNCGMATINAITQAFLRPGDTVLHTRPIYGGTDGLLYTHLIHFGIVPVGIGDALDPKSVRAAADTDAVALTEAITDGVADTGTRAAAPAAVARTRIAVAFARAVTRRELTPQS